MTTPSVPAIPDLAERLRDLAGALTAIDSPEIAYHDWMGRWEKVLVAHHWLPQAVASLERPLRDYEPLGSRGNQARTRRGRTMRFERAFAMPSGETFTIQPVAALVQRYLAAGGVSVDPFARNSSLATHTNDLDPCTAAAEHMDAEAFLVSLRERGVVCDLALFDPPYSPRQISELYRNIGLTVGTKETQNGALYRRVRDALDRIVSPGGVVLSFGWSSAGMGVSRGYQIEEILLVNHGGAHNDTICTVERKASAALALPPAPGGRSDE